MIIIQRLSHSINNYVAFFPITLVENYFFHALDQFGSFPPSFCICALLPQNFYSCEKISDKSIKGMIISLRRHSITIIHVLLVHLLSFRARSEAKNRMNSLRTQVQKHIVVSWCWLGLALLLLYTLLERINQSNPIRSISVS